MGEVSSIVPSDSLFNRNGNPVTEEQITAFNLWVDHDFNLSSAYRDCEESIIPPNKSLRQWNEWKNQKWWQDLIQTYVVSKQGVFHAKMANKSDKILDSYMRVMEGDDNDDRTAMAKMKGASMFMESGPTPLINKRPDLTINNTTAHQNNFSISVKDLHDVSTEDLLEAIQKGNVPSKVKVVSGRNR